MWQCDIQHIASSPHRHQGNGRAEVAVKVAKGLLKRLLKDNTPLWMLLLNQRNTPSKLINSSPVQRLMSRRTRTLLPVAKSLLKPHIISSVSMALYERKQHNKSRRHGTPLAELSFGQTVLVKIRPQQNYDLWEPPRSSRRSSCTEILWSTCIRWGRLTRYRKHIREAHKKTEHQSQSIELEILELADTRSGSVINTPHVSIMRLDEVDVKCLTCINRCRLHQWSQATPLHRPSWQLAQEEQWKCQDVMLTDRQTHLLLDCVTWWVTRHTGIFGCFFN